MSGVFCVGFLFFMACEPHIQVVPTPDTYCAQYKPIYFSIVDSRETKEQIDINNRRWKKVCRPAARK